MPFTIHEKLPDPPDEGRIWRYLEFTQFMSIIENGSLWFSASDQFDDPYEGAFTDPAMEEAVEKAARFDWDAEEDDIKQAVLDSRESWMPNVFLNCWHINNRESAAMWNQYSRLDSGIAIRSTVEDFIEAVDEHEEHDIHLSPVEYIDFQEDKVKPGYNPRKLLYKRGSYQHEEELRAIIHRQEIVEVDTKVVAENSILPMTNPDLDKQPVPIQHPYTEFIEDEPPTGIPVNVNLDALIERVFVAPDADEWIESLINDIVTTYEIDAQVTKSSLSKDPLE